MILLRETVISSKNGFSLFVWSSLQTLKHINSILIIVKLLSSSIYILCSDFVKFSKFDKHTQFVVQVCDFLRFEIQTRNDKHYVTNEEQQNFSYYNNTVSCIFLFLNKSYIILNSGHFRNLKITTILKL